MVIFQIGFLTLTLIDLIDLLLVSWLFYKIYMYFKGTRAGLCSIPLGLVPQVGS